MAISSFSGLASGVQWRDLIDQMIAAQSAPIVRYETQKQTLGIQKAAWATFNTKAAALQSAAAGLADASRLRTLTTTVENRSGGTAALRATGSSSAEPGSYRVDVLSLASAEKLGSDAFQTRTEALGVAGTVLVNGRELTIAASDSLDQVAERFNQLNTGTAPTGVSATVAAAGDGGYRLVLTSATRGEAGIDLKDASGNALRGLGLVDDATRLKNALPTGARSDAFSARDIELAQLLGLGAAPAAEQVTFGGKVITIDLANDTLQDIADRINDPATGAGPTATVRAETVDGATSYRLEVTGTTSFGEGGRILESLGMLEATRTSAAQELRSGAFTVSATGLAATADTKLVELSGGPQLGETVRMAGTRADGSAFAVDVEVTADTTLQHLVGALNGGAVLGSDSANPLRPTATATLDTAGVLVVTDDAAGESALSLSLTTVQADGTTGTLSDMGTSPGRSRVLAAGADAVVRVNGGYLTRGSNEIADAIPGITLNLAATGTVDVNVARDATSAAAAITGFVNAYNDLADYVGAQLRAPATGASAPPLYGSSTLRSMQSTLKAALQGTVSGGVAGTLTRMTDLGVEIDRYGRFTIDQAKLLDAVKTRPADVERFFGTTGTSADAQLGYTGSSTATQPGTYEVEVTAPATRATRTGSAFVTYATTGTDQVSVRDLANGRTYAVALADGMTPTALAQALNTAFATATTRRLESARSVGAATESTLLTALSVDAQPPSLVAGSTLSISGTRSGGGAFTADFAVTADSDVGDLLDAVRAQFGADATVSIADGRIRVLATRSGSSQLDLTITDATAGTPLFGVMNEVVEGRPTTGIVAEVVGGAVRLTHDAYGSTEGFEIGYSAGVAAEPLGAAGTTTGADVAGSIGGQIATGAGRTLTAKSGTLAADLAVTWSGSTTGSATMTFSRGIAALVEQAARAITDAGDGAVAELATRLEERIQQLTGRADTLEKRLETRREQLIRQFTAMEQAMTVAQSQSAWLTSQMAVFENKKK